MNKNIDSIVKHRKNAPMHSEIQSSKREIYRRQIVVILPPDLHDQFMRVKASAQRSNASLIREAISFAMPNWIKKYL